MHSIALPLSIFLLAGSVIAGPVPCHNNETNETPMLRKRTDNRWISLPPMPVPGFSANIATNNTPVLVNSTAKLLTNTTSRLLSNSTSRLLTNATSRYLTTNATTSAQLLTNTSSIASISTAEEKQYFSNWAGAIWVSHDITEVKGTANVPIATVPLGGDKKTKYGGAVWVGIDGDTCGTAILQTGVDWTIENGVAKYEAWYEWYPAPLTSFENFDVKPGDSISMRVVATSATSGAAYITNESTGKSVSKTFANQPPLCQTNAEWIVEDFSAGGSLIPFAGFTPVQITNSTWVSGGKSFGVAGAQLVDIIQNNKILTDCSLNGNKEVDCKDVL